MTAVATPTNKVVIIASEITPDAGGRLHTEAVLIPDGPVTSSQGDFALDAESASDVIQNFKAKQRDLVVDFNHASVLDRMPASGEAPAAGWIKEMVYVPGRGLVGLIKWLNRTAVLVKSGAYRYLSPVLALNVETLKPVAVQSVALTNTPAIYGMPSIVEFSEMQPSNGAQPMPGTLVQLNQQADEGSVATAEQKVGEIKAALEAKGWTLDDSADFVRILNAAMAAINGQQPSSDDAGEAGGGADVGNAATAEQKMGELKALLESKGVTMGEGADFVGIANVALSMIKGETSSRTAEQQNAEEKPLDPRQLFGELKKTLATMGVDAAELTDVSKVMTAAIAKLKSVGTAGAKEDSDKGDASEGEPVEGETAEGEESQKIVTASEFFKICSERDELTQSLRALETEVATRNADDLVEVYLSEGKLLENHTGQMTWARKLAVQDPEGFTAIMSMAPVVVPQGRTAPPSSQPGAGGRASVIQKAFSEFNASREELGKVTSPGALINMRLHDTEHELLTADEAREYS